MMHPLVAKLMHQNRPALTCHVGRFVGYQAQVNWIELLLAAVFEYTPDNPYETWETDFYEETDMRTQQMKTQHELDRLDERARR